MIPSIEDMELIHTDEWNSYEEGGEIEIYQLGQQYFYREGGTSVMAEPNEPYWDEISEITEDQTLALIEEWEQIESDAF